MDTIEDVVRSYVPLIYGESSKGWHSIYCEHCGDGSRSKGPRGGWLFQEEICFYHCFNCGTDCNFDPNRDVPHSKDMWDVFRAFSIPENEVKSILLAKFKDSKKTIQRKPKIQLPNLPTPDCFKALVDYPEDHVLADEARIFLHNSYKMTQADYPFFLSTGRTTSTDADDIYIAKSLLPRIIIPAYYKDKMIYWQARIFVGESPRKYLTATVENSNFIIYGMDNLHISHPDNHVLYITEGFFDSWHVNGIAITSNKMSSAQIQLIERSYRPKVVIPDFNKDGMHLANQAIELGWGVSLPDILPHIDLCKAINNLGKLSVIKSVAERTYHGYEAKLRLKDFQLKNYKFLG